MSSDQERRLLALAQANQQRAHREAPPPVMTVIANINGPNANGPNANGDIYPESVLRQVLMENAQASVELSVDSLEAQAIMDGRHTSMSMGASVEPDPTLTDLFMDNPECQDAAAALGVASVQHADIGQDPMPITFDEIPIEGTAAPNEAVRFQIGRESPPPTSFSRETFPGPSEGQVVSRRSSTGRFEAIRQAARELQPRDPVRVPHDPVRPMRSASGRLVPAPPTASCREPPPPPPTRYERLVGPDPFPD